MTIPTGNEGTPPATCASASRLSGATLSSSRSRADWVNSQRQRRLLHAARRPDRSCARPSASGGAGITEHHQTEIGMAVGGPWVGIARDQEERKRRETIQSMIEEALRHALAKLKRRQVGTNDGQRAQGSARGIRHQERQLPSRQGRRSSVTRAPAWVPVVGGLAAISMTTIARGLSHRGWCRARSAVRQRLTSKTTDRKTVRRFGVKEPICLDPPGCEFKRIRPTVIPLPCSIPSALHSQPATQLA